MKCLTVHAPWAWAIVNGHKRVENRTWRTNHRGPLLIHAGRSEDSDADAHSLFRSVGLTFPNEEELARGAIVGVVEVTDCVTFDDQHRLLDDVSRDPFATGPICWLLAKPKRFSRVMPAVGKPGMFEIDEREIETITRRQMRSLNTRYGDSGERQRPL